MADNLLACGPWFNMDDTGTIASLVMFLLVKPIAYFAYIRAFRYRVSRAIPMTLGQAARLAILRAVVGIVLVGGGTIFLVFFFKSEQGIIAGWIYLYLARVLAWFGIGKLEASLRGKRLLAWTFFGTLINVVFDVAAVTGLFGGWIYPAIGVAIIAGFIYFLEVRGKRFALVAPFLETPHCRVCQYNLTGNLSGICPECGTPIPDAQLNNPDLAS